MFSSPSPFLLQLIPYVILCPLSLLLLHPFDLLLLPPPPLHLLPSYLSSLSLTTGLLLIASGGLKSMHCVEIFQKVPLYLFMIYVYRIFDILCKRA